MAASKKNTNSKKNPTKKPAFSFGSLHMIVVIALIAIAGLATLQFSGAFSVAENEPIRFSLGNKSVEDLTGGLWETAGYTADGQIVVLNTPISDTTKPELYQSQRVGITKLSIPNLPNGRYRVHLLFADTESTGKD